jgi:endoglucanase
MLLRSAAIIISTLAIVAASPGIAADAPVAIHMNQLGFESRAPKRAIVNDPATAPLPWRLLDAKGATAAQGVTKVIGDDAASGDHVHQLDFGQVVAPGTYRLEVGGHESRPFPIAAGIYAPLKYAALNYFYQTRAGIPIEARYAGGAIWARPAGHPKEVAPCFSGKDDRGNDWPGCDYTLDVTGGWYDAGDQGKYVVNGGIALWTLQNLYEREAIAGLSAPFADGKVKIPEAGNGRNDLLDETRWEMSFLLAMQVPEGKHIKVPVGPQPWGAKLALTDIDASGMAHHKVADRVWTPLPTAPADDPQPRLLYPPSTAATLNLAATAAQCARIWRKIDPAFATRCLKASERAFKAALRNPEVYAPNTFTGSGGYGDTHLADEFYWAAAELFVTTGSPAYRDAVTQMAQFTAPLSDPSWSSTAALGTIALATIPNTLTPQEVAAQRALIITAADRFLAEEKQSGYGIPFAGTAYVWGSNGSLLNRAMILAQAERLTGQARYREGVVDAIDYVLGRNPLDQSYVTGFGANPVHNPHHRFWAHSLDPKMPSPPPGVLSGGPNSTSMGDTIASTMKGKCVGQRCWTDKAYAFTMNEVAINWNAPLFWVSAYLDEVR